MIYAVNKRTKEHEVMDPNALYNTAVWEEVHDDPDGWIEWRSGECPLPDSDRVAVRYRSGVEEECECERLRWHHTGCLGDIIAYRPILNDEPAIDVTRIATEPPAWDGEGLPPVGCEVKHPTGRGTVMLPPDVNGVTIIQSIEAGSDGEYKRVAASACRPIRSEEDRVVDQLMMDAELMRVQAERVYAAGYRKTGGEG